MGYNEGDDVANKFRNVILEDGKNRDVNMLYKLKSEFCFNATIKIWHQFFSDDLAARG